MITFYEAPFSSATPVTCALAELELPHQLVRFDLTSGIQKQPEFLAVNPNGKVPALVVDGTPMFEALAIIQWLGDRYGVQRGLWPSVDSSERLQALSWTTWAYVSLSPVIYRRLRASSEVLAPELRNPAQQALAEQEIQHLLDILEQRLSHGAYMLGESYTLVDLVLASTLTWATFTGVSLASHPTIERWLATCRARESFIKSWAS